MIIYGRHRKRYMWLKKNTYILFDANGKLISKLKYDFKWDTKHKTDRYNWFSMLTNK